MNRDAKLAELSYALKHMRDKWWQALINREWVWAAFYANDLESLGRQIASLTHSIVEEKHADPKSALGRHQGSPKQAEKGD